MIFKKYNSIENSYRDRFIYQIQEQGLSCGIWSITEKIHGANFSIYYDGNKVKFAKRSGFINDEENFMGYNSLKDFWLNKIIETYNYLFKNSNNHTLVFYGEIFGGSYPHPNIKFNNQAIRIQKEIKYHPDNQFLVFDIMIDGVFVNVDDFNNICKKYKISRVPELFKGTFQECLEYSNFFQTTIPNLYNLPEIENNFCEGVVIKPFIDSYLNDGSRVILKNKNEKFYEKRNNKEEKKNQTNILSPISEDEYQNIKTYITENRLKNVLSKIGLITKNDFGKLLGIFVQDALDDYYKDFAECPVFIEKAEQKLINKLINSDAAKIIRNNFVNIVDNNYC